MAHVQKNLWFELKIAFILLAVALINNQLFIHLTSSTPSSIVAFANLQMSFAVYVLYVAVSTIAIMLKNAHILKMSFVLLLSFLTFHIIINLYLLIINPVIADDGKVILADAFIIWAVSLIVFSLWYWIVDRGGPISRLKNDEKHDMTSFFHSINQIFRAGRSGSRNFSIIFSSHFLPVPDFRQLILSLSQNGQNF